MKLRISNPFRSHLFTLASPIALILGSTAQAVDYSFGFGTQNFTITATDQARDQDGDGQFNNNTGDMGIYWRGSASDATYMHFDLSSLAGATIVGNVSLKQTVNAQYGGQITAGRISTANGTWTGTGATPGFTAIGDSPLLQDGYYPTGSTAAWTLSNATYQGFVNSPASFHGLVLSGGNGSQAHFSSMPTLTGIGTFALISVTGATDWSTAVFDSGTTTLSVSGSNNVTGGNVVLGSAATLAILNAATLDSGSFAGTISNSGILSLGSSANQILSGAITGSGTLVKSGSSTLTLTAANSYAGATTINDGTLQIGNGGTTGSLGTGNVSIASGTTLEINRSNQYGTPAAQNFSGAGALVKNGGGNFTLNGGTGGVSGLQNLVVNGGTMRTDNWHLLSNNINLTLSGTGVFDMWNTTTTIANLSGDGTVTNTANWSGYANGAGYATNNLTIAAGTFSGTITDNGYGTGGTTGTTDADTRINLIKAGAGTLTLSGTNNYSGTTTVNFGTLQLDYSSANTTKISDIAALTLAGGTLDLKGGSHTETVISTTLAATTASKVTSSTPGSILQMKAITRGAASTIDFGASNIASTDTLNTYGILGSWATVGGTDFAMNSTDAADGLINAYTAYTNVPRRSPGVIADAFNTNVRIIEGSGAAGNITLGAATTTINTLNQSASGGTGASTLTLAGQTLQTNAVLLGATAGNLTIGSVAGGGTLTAAESGAELALTNFNASSNLLINSVIADNTASALLKSGPGTVTLAATNTYTGPTTIAAGILNANSSDAMGEGTANNTLNFGGGTLQAGGTITSPGTRPVTLTAGVVGTIDTNGNAVSIAGTISGTGGLTKIGAGTLTLTGTNTYTGMTTVSAGRMVLEDSKTGTSNFITHAELDFKVTTGTLQLNGGSISGSGKLIKTGGGGIMLGANGSPQTVALTAGALIDVQGGLLRNEYGNSAWGGNKADLNVESGAFFDIWDGNTTVDAITGSGTINKGWSADNSLTIGAADGSGTFSGTISQGPQSYGGNNGGSFSLIKTGTGTQTLSGTNTYNGATTVSGGTLALGADNVLADTTNVTIGSATLDAATFEDTVGTLNATGSAVIHLGAGANLAFANSSSVAGGNWAGTLNITGTLEPTSLRFGTTSGGLTAGQLADISVNGSGLGTYTLDADGYLVSAGGNFLSWATSQVPPITGGKNGDDDNDGVMNLVEYALVDGGERGVFAGNAITFTKRGGLYGSDLTYIIETSVTLASGSWMDEVTHGPGMLVSNPTISYTFTPGTPVKKFARLKVLTTP